MGGSLPWQEKIVTGVAGFTFEARAASWRQNAAYGLNGHRADFVIALSVITCKRAVLKSRRFTALFSCTPGPDVLLCLDPGTF